MITIDGSVGEGGGQILRTALALSLVTRQAFRIEKIRAGRPKPGLLRQHLTAVNASAQVGQAKVAGATVGSRDLTFAPESITPGDYRFAVGTAGSVTLVLQSVLPALITASGRSHLALEGGTHNPFAPPFDFLQKTFLPLLQRTGPTVTATLDRHGFFPAGGGKFRVEIEPVAKLKPFDLLERGDIQRRQARVLVAGLPRPIAEREREALRQTLSWPEEWVAIETIDGAVGPGNVVLVELGSAHVTEMFAGFGERGVPAETVAKQAADQAQRYLAADVPVGEYLADQLLLPLALAGGGSFRTLALSPHATTNLEVIRKFLEVKITVEQTESGFCVVTVG
jgi:RNA 3'-terminal phosphate cyclase (ATP)